jgi:centromeric protein E
LVEEARVDILLREKDEEIVELRARLDDKERMVSALRSAARKRDVAEVGRRSKPSNDEGRRRKASGNSGGTAEEPEDGTF